MTDTVSFHEAQRRFVATFQPVAARTRVPLADALGRVLATPLSASFDQPSADQSAMDGYAVHHADVVPGVPLRIQQRVFAGDVPRALESKSATRIFTGALVPPGADTVVMQEDAHATDTTVSFDAPLKAGMHIRRRGEDLHAGQKLVDVGVHLLPAHIGLAAMQGIDSVDVYSLLRIGILTTGDELVPTGGPRGAAQVYNSNAPMLASLVAGMGAMVVRAIHAKDAFDEITHALRELRAQCDLVLTTGGASVGERDLLRAALTSLGASFVVTGVQMKPGKPVALASYDTLPVVILPGNPGAAFTTFALLVSPLIRRLQGRNDCLPSVPRLPIEFDAAADPARDRFLRVRLAASTNGTPVLQVLSQQGAGSLLTLTQASGLSRLPADRSIAHGEASPFYNFTRWLS